MSGAKREMDRLEGLRDYATNVLKQNDAIVDCPECGEHEINNLNEVGVKSSYAQVTNDFKRGKIDGTLEEIRDAIHRAIANVDQECRNRTRGDFEE